MFHSVGSPERSFMQRAQSYVAVVFALFLFAAIAVSSVYAAGTISGVVFRDFNANGSVDSGEPGAAGIVVTAFDSSGAIQGTDTSASNGTYSLPATGTGPYRVEFTIPAALSYYLPSARSTDSVGGGSASNSGTTVQFVNDGSTSNVNLAINDPCDYCQTNPRLVTGAQDAVDASLQTTLATDFSLIGLNYDRTGQTNLATFAQTGATWGHAYQRSTELLFSSAFLKRHAGLGPRGMDGVYVLDASTNTIAGGFDLEGVTTSNGGVISLGSVTRSVVPGAIAASAAGDTQISSADNTVSVDLDSFTKIGNTGLGDIDFAKDDNTLWLVNLFDRTLIAVDTSAVTISASNPNLVPMGAVAHYNIVGGGPSDDTITGAPTCTNGQLRPFALKFYRGKGYLGAVCDASSSTTRVRPTELVGYVLSFDPTTPTSFTTETTWSFDHGREYAYQETNTTSLLSGEWQRWASSWSDFNAGSFSFVSAPQPIVSDIEFSNDGAMLVGITDRGAHQSGNNNYNAIAFGSVGARTVVRGISAGDLFRIPASGGSWGTPETSNTDPGNSPANAPSVTNFLTTDSPNGAGEFFWGDYVPRTAGNVDTHFETFTGGLAVNHSADEVVSTAFDPVTFFQQGLLWENAGTSANTVARHSLFSTGFSSTTHFGKGSGLGDLELLCDPAPVEIGNRVWDDTNSNGIQDPGEAPLAGLTVRLFRAGTPVGTAVTDANGEYYFTSTPGTADPNTADNIGQVDDSGNGIQLNTAYEIRIEPGQGGNAALLTGYSLTTQNASDLGAGDGGANADARDSDGATSSGDSIISFTTGAAGSNDHTLDIGFAAAATMDYGDLPDTGAGTGGGNYQTLATDGGPSHTIVAGLNIGAPDVVDAETGLLQNSTATADDSSDTGYADDEDGIASFPTFTPGSPASIDVTVNNVSGNPATLYGFMDWNGDGDFDDTDEVASVTVPDATVGTVSLNFNVPAGAVTGTNLGARFRLTTDTLPLDNDGAIGAASDGEVEDYVVTIGTLGAIGNYVWVDENSDGYQDKGEVGIPNVTVQLKDSGGNVIATQVTDSNGGYLFTGLGAGTYHVEVDNTTIPTGMTQTTTYPNSGADFYNQNQSVGDGYQINLGAGATNLTADFGYNWNPTNGVITGGAVDAPAALGDRIWIDTNGNGAQDANEIGVQGVEVTIYGSPGPNNIWGDGDDVPYTTGGYISTRTTDENGFYMFDDLPPGQYSVRVTDSSSASHNVLGTQYTQTGDADHWGTTGTVNDNQTTIPVVLGPGDVFLNADFGYQPGGNGGTPALGSIGNFVWYDRDADGVGPNGNGAAPGDDNTEFGLGGVTIALIQDSNANGRWDSGEPIIATTHTSDGTEDVDGDGATDPVGFYRFLSLPIADGAGTDDYLVWVNDTNNVLAGLTATYDNDGNSPASGLATGLGISAVTNLGTTGGSPYGTNDATDQDFGYTDDSVPGATNPGMIGDRVWLDLNNDGIQDANEPGIPGVEMELYDSDGTTLLATTTTGANGLYLFPNLNVDDGGGSHQYYVRVDWTTLPGGISQTYDYDGLGTPDESTRTLTPADPVQIDQDFGYVGSGSIGNFVWLDTNANGIVDGSDASQGIEGVTVDLYDDVNRNGIVDAGDIKLSTTTTSANGSYLFTGLPTEDIDEGDAYYVVNVTDTAGVLTGYWHSLGNQAVTFDNTSKASPYSVILATGTTATENVLTVDFGYYVVPGAVGNYVWLDTDKDGIQGAGENGINGVTVTLEITYPNGTVTTITTVTQTEPGGTRDGWYSFGNLLQDEHYNGLGTYGREPTFNITVTMPPGYTASPMGNGTPTTDSNDPTGTGAQPFKGQTNVLFANDSAPIASYDFGIYLSPTAVDVNKVRVKVTADNAVQLRWRSVSEAQIAGFNIQRSDAADGAYTNVNTEFITAKASGNALGKGYKFLDSTVAAGSTYWYRIEIMHTDASVMATEPRSIRVGDSACNAALTAPELLAPLNDAQVKAGKVRLQWQAVTCAAYYRVQVKPDARDAKLVLNRKHLKTALTVKDLVKGASYQWRVQACSANGECVASDWQKFEIKK